MKSNFILVETSESPLNFKSFLQSVSCLTVEQKFNKTLATCSVVQSPSVNFQPPQIAVVAKPSESHNPLSSGVKSSSAVLQVWCIHLPGALFNVSCFSNILPWNQSFAVLKLRGAVSSLKYFIKVFYYLFYLDRYCLQVVYFLFEDIKQC